MKTLAVLAAVLFLGGIEVGNGVSKFKAIDDQGKEWVSSEHIGKHPVVIYFYPADMTPGCTKQACSFRDDMAELKKLGVEVVGVSGDTPENHQIFKKAHHLNYTLLADPKGEIAKLFGVPTKAGGTVKKEFEGKEVSLTQGVRASRWTYVIGPDGTVVFKNTEVNPEKDSKAVIEVVKKLNEGKKAS
jgi:peroxiredoxin Q/BCP